MRHLLPLLVIACISLALTRLPVSAAMPDQTLVTNEKSPRKPVFTLPQTALAVTENIFSLGTAVDPASGELVEGYAIVHYKKAPERQYGNAKKPGGQTMCYTYLARDAKWKAVEPWTMNSANARGLDENTTFALMQQGIAKWEDATDGVINTVSPIDILGNGATTSAALTADETAPDNQNEVYFGEIAGSDAIGVTTVWGVFSGPAIQRKLVEWDMVFDDVTFDWSTTEEITKMDFENIATHELGHAIGLGDLYNTCVSETMYGYASEGETNKRTLHTGDLQGTNNLY